LLIRGGLVMDPESGRVGFCDVRTEGGKILEVAPNITLFPSEEIVSADGCIVAPGFVDLHVHFRDPGLTHKEDLSTGSLSAAAGGFTSVVCMANTKPVMDSSELVRGFYHKAGRVSIVNVFTVGSVTLGMEGQKLTDFKALKASGVVGFSDDGNPVENAALMREAMEKAGEVGLSVIAHEGDLNLVADTIVNEGPISASLGLKGMPAAAEDIHVARDIFLAELTGLHVHIQHVSSAVSINLIRLAKTRGVNVTAEACPHHFSLTDEALLSYGTNAKMNPPLRDLANVAAVCQGLADGTLDVIATDHAPHTDEEKGTDLAKAPCGIVGLETAFGLVWTRLVKTGMLTPMQALAKLTCYPARVIGFDKGTLKIGKDADITIFDPNLEWEVKPEEFFSKSRNTPFGGWRLHGRVVTTIVGGKVVYQLGRTGNPMEQRPAGKEKT